MKQYEAESSDRKVTETKAGACHRPGIRPLQLLPGERIVLPGLIKSKDHIADMGQGDLIDLDWR